MIRRLFLLALVGIAVAVPALAEEQHSSLERLITLGQQPLMRVADLGGIIGAKSVDFTDGSDYLKMVVPPTIFPFQKSSAHIVMVVNLSLDIMHADYHIAMFNPRDIIVHCDSLSFVPTVRVVNKELKHPEKGIWIHLTMSPAERNRSPAILPGFTK